MGTGLQALRNLLHAELSALRLLAGSRRLRIRLPSGISRRLQLLPAGSASAGGCSQPAAPPLLLVRRACLCSWRGLRLLPLPEQLQAAELGCSARLH